MSADRTRHDDTPDGDEHVVPSISSLIQMLESPECPAVPQLANSDAQQHPEPTPAETLAKDEVLATLLRAIENSDIAARLHGAEPLAVEPCESASVNLPKSDETVHAATPPAQSALPPEPVQAESLPDAESWKPAPVADRPSETPLSASLISGISRLAMGFGAATVLIDRAGKKLEGWLQNLLSRDPRSSPRLAKPPLVAYYWTGSTPIPHEITNISSSGLYLLTEDRWYPGTTVSMTLQRTDVAREEPESWITVKCLIVRHGADGLGGMFIPLPPRSAYSATGRAENCVDQRTLNRFVNILNHPTHS